MRRQGVLITASLVSMMLAGCATVDVEAEPVLTVEEAKSGTQSMERQLLEQLPGLSADSIEHSAPPQVGGGIGIGGKAPGTCIRGNGNGSTATENPWLSGVSSFPGDVECGDALLRGERSSGGGADRECSPIKLPVS